MRILILADRYPPEARSVAVLYQELAESLARRGHDVHVLTKMPTDYVPGMEGRVKRPVAKKVEQLGGVSVTRVRGLSSLHTSPAFRAAQHIALVVALAPALARIPRPDVVLVYSPPLLLAAAVALYSRGRRVPYVLNLHDLYPRTAVQLGMLKNRFVIWIAQQLEALAYGVTKAIIVPAPGSRAILCAENGVAESKVHFVPNWVDLEDARPGPKANAFRGAHGLADRFVISYAGVMGFVQDLTTLIECARLMQGNDRSVFLLAGDGVYVKRWKELAAGLPSVRFLPMLPKPQYFEMLLASDVCVVALSDKLGSPAIPGKVQSIMAVGRPIVATVPPSSDAAQVITDSRSGFVIRPGQIEQLRRTLERLMEDPHLADELGRNGRRFAERHFSLEAAVSAYERILLDAASGSGQRGVPDACGAG